MKQVENQKYTVAWFKLAECVARREKERAFGVYRLLAHSFNDDALAAQLAGDLFLSFQDIPNAVEKYVQAARVHQANGQTLPAAAVYEHIITLQPDHLEYRLELIDLYRVHNSARAFGHLKVLLSDALQKKEWDKARELIKKMESCSTHQQAALLSDLVCGLAENSELAQEVIVGYAHKAIDRWVQAHATKEIDLFLDRVADLNESTAEKILEYMQQKSEG